MPDGDDWSMMVNNNIQFNILIYFRSRRTRTRRRRSLKNIK